MFQFPVSNPTRAPSSEMSNIFFSHRLGYAQALRRKQTEHLLLHGDSGRGVVLGNSGFLRLSAFYQGNRHQTKQWSELP